MGREETLLVLRAYQAHPTNWTDVLDDVKGNVQQMPLEARDLYGRSSTKQLKDRISSKFGKLLAMDINNIKDIEIRNEIEKIKAAERRLVQRTVPLAPPVPDRREAIVNEMSDDSDPQEAHNHAPNPVPRTAAAAAAAATPVGHNAIQLADQQPGPAPRPETGNELGGAENRGRSRKRPLAALIRDNQLAYNKFITRKVPKLLRELGISSSDDE